MLSTRPARAPGNVDRALGDLRRVVDEVQRDPFVNGRDIDVTLQPNAAKQIAHGLGRAFTSYALGAARGGGVAYSIVETARDADSVTLECVTAGGAVTIGMRIW